MIISKKHLIDQAKIKMQKSIDQINNGKPYSKATIYAKKHLKACKNHGITNTEKPYIINNGVLLTALELSWIF